MHSGYMLVADISGYTAFLTQSELGHANPILRELLSSLVSEVGDPLHFWRMDGDAVLAYTTDHEFPSGEAFLTICEGLYNTFAAHRQNIIANTTCTCRACSNVQALDLKILAHHGEFELMEIGSSTDISGPDVILVHRMAKTDVKEVTGIGSYAMFTSAALAQMNVPLEAIVEYQMEFEHFGTVTAGVYDLAVAWERQRSRRDRVFLAEEDGVYTERRFFSVSSPVLWQAVTDPAFKLRWMQMVDVQAMPDGIRLGTGTRYHCKHELADFVYTVTDWEPHTYFSTVMRVPGSEDLTHRETYELLSTPDGTELRYTMGQVIDGAGERYPDVEAENVGFLQQYWPVAFDALDEEFSRRTRQDADGEGTGGAGSGA